ncbi:hypothetical protein [Kingella negevensis]|uniref:Lumazine-binding domain protein n=2 Tax=Kingella negevensis TaxID=1522312 RepID=A0A238T8J6_9NEIS|nr:hypothetical protein [Kingella negevensis]MDK4683748.1 hypothetical protein [Kingella negevensis]MDK4693588.1 hypothetical protein [Kingella negevensis]MDK4697060.1 hypothetical protein [Kingella negevensis]MDK4700404.1 hypothetical protein [Kingella negevensis]MDK4708248.1 hypothetical protein [Kingella negevensis]
MLGISKETVVIAVVAYFGYDYYVKHDVTPFPPMKGTVEKAITQSNLEFNKVSDIEIVNNCRRTSGSVLEKSVFTCGIEYTQNGEMFSKDIRITKTKGKWKIVE